MTSATTVLRRDQNSLSFNSDLEDITLYQAPNSTEDVEEVEMGIAEDGIGFLLDLLSDLSVNRGAYAIREAYSNAYDATLATGDMSLPIEITLPEITKYDMNNIMSKMGYTVDLENVQCVSIKDHGIGMTTEDVRNYFTQYGGSKKRNTNDVATIGSKGLGSKAPLACSDVFSVITVKDGVKTTALIERSNNRNYAKIRHEETTEENGTEIRIPVSDEQVATQMNDCINDIIEWNLDANLIVNGKTTTPFLHTTENGIDPNMSMSTQYVYLGYVNCGEDENGNPIDFRMWERADAFPASDIADNSIQLNLAGVHYTLVGSKNFFGRYPMLIVAGDPGYLNFTPSRDEIKDDHAKRRFIAAIKEALRNHDFSLNVASAIKGLPMYRIANWIYSRGYDFHIVDSDTVKLDFSQQRISQYYSPRSCRNFVPDEIVLPRRLFVNDKGVDCVSLFDSDADNTGEHCFNVFAFNGRRSKRFRVGYTASSTNTRNNTLNFKDIRKTDILGERHFITPQNVFKATGAHRSDLLSYYAIVIKNINVEDSDQRNENWVEFAKWEKNIRDCYGYETENVIYFFMPKGVNELSGIEEEVLGSMKKVHIVEFADVIKKAKNFRSSNRRERHSSVGMTYTELTNHHFYNSFAYKLYENDNFNPFYDGNQHENVCNIPAYKPFGGYSDFPELVKKNIFVFGKKLTASFFTPMIEIASGMKAMGNLPSDIESLIYIDSITVEEVKTLMDAGAIVFADLRKNVKNHVQNVLDNNEKIISYDIENNHFVVDAQLVFPRYDNLTENEKVDQLICSSDKENGILNNPLQMHLLCSLADENKYPILSSQTDLLDKFLTRKRNPNRFSSIDLVYSATNNSVNDMKKLFEEVSRIATKIFKDLDVSAFYFITGHHTINDYYGYRRDYHYDIINGAAELLRPGVNEQLERVLATTKTEGDEFSFPFRVAA